MTRMQKNQCTDVTHTSSYTTDLYYVTLQVKQTISCYTIFGYRVSNNTETILIGKSGFARTDISCLGT
jgi:hypothetical protein